MKQYLLLCKPGIVFGNLASVSGGFFLASKGNVDIWLFFATIIGVSLVVASGCVFNNCIDRDIDSNMKRTQNRAMVLGIINPLFASCYASVLGIVGVLLLYLKANTLSAMLVIFGFVVYVVLYSMWLKRSSVYGTIVGSLSGAMPPVVGYCAVLNKFDLGALILLIMFSLWQMPHSYAIAIFRLRDYQNANIPVLPVVEGIETAKKHMICYVIAFCVIVIMLNISGYVGYKYLVVTSLFSGYWLWLTMFSYVGDYVLWARKVFFLSIMVIMVLSFMMAVDYVDIPYNQSIKT